MSQANTGIRPIPRKFAREVFRYAFDVLHRKMVFAVVSEGNEQALRVNRFLGFQEDRRWPGMALHDHDLLLLTMTREQCRFLEKPNDARHPAGT
jgi:RimJ/RimL family protein N-acetyltransferase